MKKNNLFHKLYDILYSSKDYEGEVQSLLTIVKRHHPQVIKKILEIGCGTGNHTIEFAKTKKRIIAIDTDVFMAARAKEKTRELKNVSIHFSSVEKLNEKGFDVAVAAFNVITYIPDMKSLLSLCKSVSASLRFNGIFIFDCWNGIAAIKDPPKTKTIQKNLPDSKIVCEIKSHTDIFRQKTVLEYEMKVTDKKGNTINRDSFFFNQTLWMPVQLEYALVENGFQIIKCCKNFTSDEEASESDWKIMFVCRKTSRV